MARAIERAPRDSLGIEGRQGLGSMLPAQGAGPRPWSGNEIPHAKLKIPLHF